LGFRGDSDSGFSSCAAPTYYHASKYFYNQHLDVWKFNLELSIALIEISIEFIINLEYFQIVWKSEFGSSE